MEAGPIESINHLLLQLAIILFLAKLAGEVCERYLRQPPVLGELIIGIIIGPYALGGIPLLGLGPLFPAPQSSSGLSVSNELYAVAQIGVVLLLFVAGLETDLKRFLRYGAPAALIALGGVVLPFFLGAAATWGFGFAPNMAAPTALFMGAILTATSVGITTRVLSDIKRLDSTESITILAAAVIDDVIGIIVLAIVVSLGISGVVSIGGIAALAGWAIGFWLALLAGGILLSVFISRFFLSFKVAGAAIALSLALAFFASALAGSFGLATIIGAYSIGLALSNTDVAKSVDRSLNAIYHFLVPVFFVVMGMQVNLGAMGQAWLFGIVVTVLAILGKLAGCGLPALGVGFGRLGALRIGLGMLPRGEVALIVAGVGLAYAVVSSEIFGVAVMVTIVTTLVAPPLLVRVFRRGASDKQPRD